MYEYFASTLPSFAFGAPPPMSAEELRAAAEGNLRAADLAALDALLSGGPSDHPFVAAWRDRDTQLRNAVARARAARGAASGGASSAAAGKTAANTASRTSRIAVNFFIKVPPGPCPSPCPRRSGACS